MDAIISVEMPTDEQVRLAAETFQLLGDATRIRLLWLLFQGEHSVGNLAEMLGAHTAAVSQHLAKLRLAGLVRQRRSGNYVYYAAVGGHVRQLLQETLHHADHLVQGLPEHGSVLRATAVGS